MIANTQTLTNQSVLTLKGLFKLLTTGVAPQVEILLKPLFVQDHQVPTRQSFL